MTTLTPATLTTDNCWGLLLAAPRKFLDTLLRAHQEEVARLEQQQREDAA